jgi:hypothetical protein
MADCVSLLRADLPVSWLSTALALTMSPGDRNAATQIKFHEASALPARDESIIPGKWNVKVHRSLVTLTRHGEANVTRGHRADLSTPKIS